jgi:NAD(P)-dependent dehydrogenase (short-subunit alcohol dehydrogenase family)
MDKRLNGKIAIITGAGTGIGEAIAHKFAKEGAAVVLNGLPGDPVEDVVMRIRSHGARAVSYLGDVSEEAHARGCVQAAIDSFGRLDVLINNAGTFPVTSELQDYPIEAFDMMTRANVRSVFLMTRYALPHLQKTRGCIVSAGSESGLIGLAENAPYGATKGWIHAFMRGVAVEQAKHGIRANCVCPGAVDTAWTHKETGPMDRKMEKTTVEATPMGRRGTVEEIANVYAFLASEEASFVTGALWVVDGGITIAKGPVGKETPRDLRQEPKGELHDLAHTHEGLEVQPVGGRR